MVDNERAKDSNRIKAIEVLLGYAFGRPKASVDIDVQYDITQDFLAAIKAVNQQISDESPVDAKPVEKPKRLPKELQHS